MKVRVRLFSLYRERAGVPQAELDLQTGATVSDALAELERRFARLEDLRQRVADGVVLVAVNREFRGPEASLQEGDEVAVFPPVAGGR